ncbi:MAG: 16S rRNA (uracil(1498)-N(3))-methyltransferase [Lysobacteraceae bacterium]|nr:MAG: 16S rRNA (uracil(1498)-N(3))-methyltransferase [Xanthomonadaceae bacterium]
MRVTRLHVDRALAVGARLDLPADAANYLVRVLRLDEGDRCVLFNGDGHDYEARLVAAGKRGVEVEVLSAAAVGSESPLRITLLQGIARGEKMDLVLQKATELGVAAFLPVSSERSEVRLDEARAGKRLAHWHGIVASACGQCGRARVPTVAAPSSLDSALRQLPPGPRFLLDPAAADSIATVAAFEGDCVLAVGPEGGWSQRDRGQLAAAGFRGLRLGPRILRTETAGLAAIAALQARFGDL